MSLGDIDIDISPLVKPKLVFKNWTPASMIQQDEYKQHPVGVYPQRIAVHPLHNLSAIPYAEAESLGYLKIDFLNLNVYKHFSSHDEIETLLDKEPDWALLLLESTYPSLFQLSKHYALTSSLKPSSIEDLADVLALIRPGKKALQGLYKKSKGMARDLLWEADSNGYVFKKSHAISYAMVIVLQLHLIERGDL